MTDRHDWINTTGIRYTVFNKSFAAAAVAGAALLTVFCSAGTASAAPAHHPHSDSGHHNSVSILSNLCVAPWQWNGPIEALTLGHTAGYAACNGNSVDQGEGHHVSILDNVCVAPWQWNGPIEALTAGHGAEYLACNDNSVG